MELNHLAIIPDGNRRWAKARLLLPWQGHEEGVKRFWEIAKFCASVDIKFLTFWGGSYSNLVNRSPQEVKILFKILTNGLTDKKLLEQLIENEISIKIIGEWHDIVPDAKFKKVVNDIEDQTKQFSKRHLTILFGYDGQREMIATIKKMQQNNIEVTAQVVQANLFTAILPEVDLVIRTGGEPHWSAGFLMWQTANSQFYFTKSLWPDFKIPQLKKAFEDYQTRERRFGK